MLTDILQNIESKYEKGEDFWDDTVNAVIQAFDSKDDIQWFVGDICILIKTRYGSRSEEGEDVLKELAHEVNRRVSTIREYYTMAKFWIPEPRTDMLEKYPVLNYSHLREAMNYASHCDNGDIEDALDILHWAIDALEKPRDEGGIDSISCEAIKAEADKRLDRKRKEKVLTVMGKIEKAENGFFIVSADDMSNLVDRAVYQITFHTVDFS